MHGQSLPARTRNTNPRRKLYLDAFSELGFEILVNSELMAFVLVGCVHKNMLKHRN